MSCCFFFFFQAEDGIRDLTVTGVQTCALPILAEDPLHLEDVEREVLTGHLEGDELDVVACGHPMRSPSASRSRIGTSTPRRRATALAQRSDSPCGTGSAASRTTSSASSTSKARSEERRVGKECRSRW